MRIPMRLVLVMVIWTAGGCASAHPGSGATPPAAPRADHITVQVENHHWQDVKVYLLRDHLKVRLGTVTSMSSAVFQIRETLLTGASQVRLTAEPTGFPDPYVTELILLMPGQSVRLQLENNLLLSRYSVR